MVLKCLKLKNHVLETWMLENMSNIGSNLSIAMHLHVHNGEIMDETRLLLTGPHARWMTSDGVKLCDAGTHIGVTNDWNPISVKYIAVPCRWQMLVFLPDKNGQGCITVLMRLQRYSHWLRCVLGSQMQLCAYYRCKHTCTIPVGWPCMHMHHDWCHTFQVCKWYSGILCDSLKVMWC